MPPKLDLTHLIEQALEEPYGLLLASNDPPRARAQLYEARRACTHPDAPRVQIRQSPFPDGHLVLCRVPESQASAPSLTQAQARALEALGL